MVNLVIQTAFLGDLLLSIPLLKQIKLQFPNDELHLLCRSGFSEIIEELQLVDRVYAVNKKSKKNLSEVKVLLQAQEYRFVISPHQSFRSALLVKSLKCEKSIGFVKWWNRFFFSDRLVRPMQLPDALRQLSLLSLVSSRFVRHFEDIYSLSSVRIGDNKQEVIEWCGSSIPEWSSMDSDVSESKNSVAEGAILFAPGSVWETKKWSKEHYISLGQELVQRERAVIVLGSPGEKELCESIVSQIPGAQSLAGRISLLETLKVMRQGSALVCNDSGAMHMAAVVGLPTVSIFGPTTLDFGYRPWQFRAVVVQKKMDCRPCGLHGAKKCPLNHHNCMKSVLPKQVLDQLLKMKVLSST